MRKSRSTDERIPRIVREVEGGAKVLEVCRRHGIAKNTLARWQARYCGLEVAEATRLKVLEDENRRLKRLVAALSLDNALLEDVVGRKW